MRIYGNQCIEITGVISETIGYFVKIWFQNYEKEAFVPLYLIKSQIPSHFSSPRMQKFVLPIWFLKKQRILPLSIGS
ncbi:hypothetical protein DSAG12_00718 [Promethearchaeum syntrophicum]|uniref:Uncharacterized protein n=1 Tax=Promethearchaeum syntrophicum TaxID=2594042 RepID=A0A5B9D7P8_9ARCH|nr:hypothetical protein [Candidatus Prometheoarchaeum syntrophicum]QEE14897.1 hypothetical protein DSAG12_00718 [Candidatus Prometheoarchaeum syntrophicum]